MKNKYLIALFTLILNLNSNFENTSKKNEKIIIVFLKIGIEIGKKILDLITNNCFKKNEIQFSNKILENKILEKIKNNVLYFFKIFSFYNEHVKKNNNFDQNEPYLKNILKEQPKNINFLQNAFTHSIGFDNKIENDFIIIFNKNCRHLFSETNYSIMQKEIKINETIEKFTYFNVQKFTKEDLKKNIDIVLSFLVFKWYLLNFRLSPNNLNDEKILKRAIIESVKLNIDENLIYPIRYHPETNIYFKEEINFKEFMAKTKNFYNYITEENFNLMKDNLSFLKKKLINFSKKITS